MTELNLNILSISKDKVNELIKKGKRPLSYSLINKANNEQEFMSYIRGDKILSVAFTYGIQAHASMVCDKICVDTDIKSRIDTEKQKVYLSYNDVSETMIMRHSIENCYNYKIKHMDKLQYEKQVYSIINFNNKQFIVKAYIDAYNSNMNTIVEFKTTSNAFNIDKTIFQYNYDLQAYLYTSIIHSHYNNYPNFEFFFLNKKNVTQVIFLPINNRQVKEGQQKLLDFLIKSIKILTKYNLISIFQI